MENNPTTNIKSANKIIGVASGTFAGIIVGIVGGVLVILVGLVLTATVIGAIIGIPLIIMGIGMMGIAPLQGTAMGFMTKKAECPYCHNELSFVMKKALTCKYCKKRLLVRGKELVLVE